MADTTTKQGPAFAAACTMPIAAKMAVAEPTEVPPNLSTMGPSAVALEAELDEVLAAALAIGEEERGNVAALILVIGR